MGLSMTLDVALGAQTSAGNHVALRAATAICTAHGPHGPQVNWNLRALGFPKNAADLAALIGYSEAGTG